MKKLTSQKAIRSAFWNELLGRKPAYYKGKSQNELPADIRMSFVDFVDRLQKNGEISERLAERVTL